MMNLKYSLFILLFCFISNVISSKENSDTIVTISEGKVRGSVETLFDGSQFYSFRGIPYASPPVGNLRFKAPTPPKSWKGIRSALKFGSGCTQFNSTSQGVNGDEDCLFINVYTKSLNKNAKKPVMVYIFGGSFTEGSGNFYGPEFLIQHDVILVTFNYRLEVLGFLSLEIPDVPGNAAMKDQVAALRWVQRNVAQFGGDPNSVTLFGESAGALCVFLHMLSPMSKGLFDRAIAQSGTYEFAETKGAKERAFRVGKLLGIETDDVQELLTYFKTINANKLANVTVATLTLDEMYRGLISKFLPVVEKKFPGVEAFLDEDPTKLILEDKLNRVPLIIGYNSGEGLIIVRYHIPRLEVYNREPSFYVPREIYDRITKKQLIEFGDRIKKFYVGDRNITENDLDIIRDMQTDILFAYTNHRIANLYSLLCEPTYMYRFDSVTELNIVKKSLNLPNLEGASHVDDIFYLFNNDLNRDLYNTQPKLRDIVFKVTKLWTNFAKTGRPTLDNSFGATWLPYTVSGKEYFKIDEQFKLEKYADQKRMEFWNELYKEAGLLHISDNEPIVRVKEGKLRGTVGTLVDGSSFYSFKGIPFAAPPVGDLRFKAPLPPRRWKGIRDASNFGAICAQYNTTYQGDEDCLFINVYTKSLNKQAKIPVMVYIYGGSYYEGSGDFFTPDFFLQHDVILVTFNYRLEVLGFLSLDIPEVPGNAGMKDQVAALKWVQQNIDHFGGDKTSVTIFGESSGASSVTHHMLSPMSRELFHKVIAQSGASTHDWAIGRDPVPRAFRAGKILGIDTNDTTELLNYFRSLEASALTNLTFSTLTADEKYRGLPEKFIPVIEKKFPNVEAFLDEEPIETLVNGDNLNEVPLMLGYNSGEGLIIVNDHITKLDVYNNQPSYYVPKEVADKLTDKKLKEYGDRIKRFYVGDRNLTKDDLEIISDMQTDMHFAFNTQRFAHLYSYFCSVDTYLYRFGYETDLNIIKIALGLQKLRGASHADELFYLFYNYLNAEAYKNQPELRSIVYKVTKLWTNFAKTGNPTPDNTLGIKWLPYTTEGNEYFKLDSSFTMDSNADKDRMDFWDKLYSEAGLQHLKYVTSSFKHGNREGTITILNDGLCQFLRELRAENP